MLSNQCDEKSQLEQDWVLTHAKYKVSRKDPCFLTYCTYSTSAVKESKKNDEDFTKTEHIRYFLIYSTTYAFSCTYLSGIRPSLPSHVPSHHSSDT